MLSALVVHTPSTPTHLLFPGVFSFARSQATANFKISRNLEEAWERSSIFANILGFSVSSSSLQNSNETTCVSGVGVGVGVGGCPDKQAGERSLFQFHCPCVPPRFYPSYSCPMDTRDNPPCCCSFTVFPLFKWNSSKLQQNSNQQESRASSTGESSPTAQSDLPPRVRHSCSVVVTPK